MVLSFAASPAIAPSRSLMRLVVTTYAAINT
jgi:hypothetical protein